MDELRTVEAALVEIASNSAYIRGELPGLHVAPDVEARVLATCEELLRAAGDVRRSMGAVRDRIVYRTGLEPDLDRITARIGEATAALHGTVTMLDERSNADATLALASILLNESGANVLRAAAAIEGAIAAIPDRLRAPPAVEPATKDHLTFGCSMCSRVAGQFRLQRGSAGWVLYRLSFTSDMGGTRGGPDELEALREAREAQSPLPLYRLDLEWTPFYCPDCDACYCGDHYRHWDVFDDDDSHFHDSIRGCCPKGHERMLED